MRAHLCEAVAGSLHEYLARVWSRGYTYRFRDLTKEVYRENSKLAFTDIKHLLVTKWLNVSVSISTIKRARKEMEWVCSLGGNSAIIHQPHVKTT